MSLCLGSQVADFKNSIRCLYPQSHLIFVPPKLFGFRVASGKFISLTACVRPLSEPKVPSRGRSPVLFQNWGGRLTVPCMVLNVTADEFHGRRSDVIEYRVGYGSVLRALC
ncbi:hypothetical protein TNCV_454601 [Trichonephila clavipes]|nr:hypothetical protein TNCV_454601 [Trichonephila clavipes]